MRALLLAGVMACGWAGMAHATYVVTFAQQGDNVVATGAGSLDLTGLSYLGVGLGRSIVDPGNGAIVVGPSSGNVDIYAGFTGPSRFGSGSTVSASANSGSTTGIQAGADYLGVPEGFVSGGSLSGTATFDDATIAGLGLTPGQYVYTWNVPDDSFVVNIPAAATVPEPASLALLALPLGLIGLLTMKQRDANGT